MTQAKASLIYALGRLKPADRFNVIRFDDTMDGLFPDTVPADAEHLAQATQGFVSAIRGTRRHRDGAADEGGADRSQARAIPNFLRQVVFLTDGEIGNEQQLFDAITDGARALAGVHGRHRLGPQHLSDDAAPPSSAAAPSPQSARSTRCRTVCARLFDKLESPVVTNLDRHPSPPGGADMTPSALPDLYRGEPLVLAARSSASPRARSRSGGMIGSRPWAVTLPVDKAAPGKGLSKLWARRKIADAEVAQTLRQITPDEADKRILALGARAPSRHPAHQPGRRRPHAEPAGGRAPHPRRPAAEPARGLGLRQGRSAATAKPRRVPSRSGPAPCRTSTHPASGWRTPRLRHRRRRQARADRPGHPQRPGCGCPRPRPMPSCASLAGLALLALSLGLLLAGRRRWRSPDAEKRLLAPPAAPEQRRSRKDI